MELLSRLAPVPLAVSGVIALSLLSAALGIGLIAFINLRLITAVDTSLRVLPEFWSAGAADGGDRVRSWR